MSYLTSGGNINLQLRVPTSAYYGQMAAGGTSNVPGPTGPTGKDGPTGMATLVTDPNIVLFLGQIGYSPVGPTGGGTGSSGFDYALVRNIGMHAYINDASISYSFNNVTNALTYNITVLGNAIYYDMTFSYNPPLTVNSYTYSSANTLNYNNSVTSGQPNLTFTIPFTVTPNPGNYTVTISIDTHNTGGTGSGSYITKTLPIYLPASDSMGYPFIAAPYSILGVTGSTSIVSGITYFTNGAYVPVFKDQLSVGNIYNVNDNRIFNYNTLSGSSSGSFAASTLEYLNGSGYSSFPHIGGNVNYFNSANFNMPINSTSQVLANLVNAIGKTSSNIPYFPTTNTWIGGQSLIGYVYPVPDEVTIPLRVETSSAVKSLTRCTIPSSEGTPDTPVLANVVVNVPGVLASLSTNDCAYYPYDGYFHADNFTTVLNSTYILPRTAAFSSGAKYLLIKISTQGFLRTFVLHLGNLAGIVNTWALWNSSSTPTTWYNWSIPSNNAGGCGGGSSGSNITLQLNTAATYTVVGDIYVNIKFTGYIDRNALYLS